MNGVAVHVAVESHLIRGWALEGEARFPVGVRSWLTGVDLC